MPFPNIPNRVLVVDDEENIRKSLSGLLEDNGYEVVTAVAGMECLKLLSEQYFPLVLLDIVMPVMSGIEVLQRIREKHPDTEVVMVSGYADKERAIAAFRQGAYDLIEKPFESKEILNTVAHCLNQQKLRNELAGKTRELGESEEKYHSIFTQARDGIVLVDEKTGRICDCNPEYERQTGRTLEQMKKLKFWEMGHPDTAEIIQKQFVKMKDDGPGSSGEYELRRPDGTIVPVEYVNRAVEIGGGRFIQSITRDISERKKAEEFIGHILESVDEGFIVIDRDFNVQSANKAYCQMAGMPQGDVIGRHCYEVSHALTKPCYEAGEECPVRHSFETGEPATADHTHFDSHGNPYFTELKSFPMRDRQGNVVSVIEVIVDITEKKKLEMQLFHSKKMEAVGTLTGGIAHEFNNLLTVITGYGDFLRLKLDEDNPLKLKVESILSASDKAADLTRNLLAFARKQVLHLKPVNVNNLAKKTELILSRILGDNIRLILSLAKTEMMIMADSGQVEQALTNLATNARDAMKEGGRLTIGTDLVTMNDDFIKSHGYGKAGKYALLTMADTGTGMDTKTLGRIFEPFFTTKDMGKEAGLGLAIVYGIIKQHNGFIDVQSEPGKGTTFSIYIPLSDDDAGKHPGAKSPASTSPSAG